MRILHVISSFGVGGAETIAVEVCRRLAREHDVRIQTVRRTSETETAVAVDRKAVLDDAAVAWTEGKASSGQASALVAPFELLRTIAQFDPHIVHSHTDVPDFCLSLARRLRSFRIARTIHNTKLWATRRASGRLAESRFHDDLVIAINGPTLNAYRDLRGGLGLPVSAFTTTIANGVRVLREDEYADSDASQHLLHADPRKFQVAFIGRLDEQKGFDVLLDALAALDPAVGSGMQVHVMGDGAMRDRALSASSAGRIVFHGAVSNARRWLKTMQLVVMPSRYEGQPLLAVETMMAGVPLLIADVAGLRDVMPANWPLKVPVEDSAALASLLSRCVTGQAPVAKTPEGWLAQFDADAMAGAYARAYAAYVAATPKPGRARQGALAPSSVNWDAAQP